MSHLMHLIVPALVYSFLSATVSHGLYRGDECMTREGFNGVCLPIQHCPRALREVKARRMPTHCGFEGSTPIVCCDEDPQVTMTQQTKPPANIFVVNANQANKPDEGSKKASLNPRWTTTLEPKPPTRILIVHSNKNVKPSVDSKKTSTDPEGTTTLKPKRVMIPSSVIPVEDKPEYPSDHSATVTRKPRKPAEVSAVTAEGSQKGEYRDNCTTREGFNGVCLPIHQCPRAVREVRTRRMPTHCGFDRFTQIVCCVEDPRGTMTQQPKPPANIFVVNANRDNRPDEGSKKASLNPRWTTTLEPKPPTSIFIVNSEKDKKPDEDSKKASKDPQGTTTLKPNRVNIPPLVIPVKEKHEDPSDHGEIAREPSKPAVASTVVAGGGGKAEDRDACKTREGLTGVCRPIHACPRAMMVLRSGWWRSNCGQDSRTPTVCCVEQPHWTSTRDPKSDAEIFADYAEKFDQYVKPSEMKPEFVREDKYLEGPLMNEYEGINELEDPVESIFAVPSGITTPGPETPAVISAVTDGDGGMVEEPPEFIGKEAENGGSEVPTKRIPGEAATYWCERFFERCISSPPPNLRQRRQLQRPILGLIPELIPEHEKSGAWEEAFEERPYFIGRKDLKVAGGKDASRNEFPHMAAVGYGKQDDIRWQCGGSLISETFVLTAAHCLTTQNGSMAEWVLLGSLNISDPTRGYSESKYGVVYHVKRRIRHPEYKRRFKYNDIALLELGHSLQNDETDTHDQICPACLQVEWNPSVTVAQASGWGLLGFGEDPSYSLQKVFLKIFDNSVCNEKYAVEITSTKLFKGIDESMICAGDLKGGKDTCQGDSGGPLQHNTNPFSTYIIGVTSFGKICGFADSPAIYTRISYYIPWIESIVWPE